MVEVPSEPCLPSGRDDEFVEPVNKGLQCGICRLPMKETMITSNGHHFCRGCIEEHLPREEPKGQNDFCPVDREAVNRDKVPPENMEVHLPSHKEHVNLLLNEIRKLRDQIATLREEGKENQEAHEAEIQRRNEKECALKKQMDEKEKALKKQIDEKEKALKKQVDEKEKALKREMEEKGKWFKYASLFLSIIIAIISVIGYRSFGDMKGQMDGKDQALQAQFTILYYIAGIVVIFFVLKSIPRS